MSEISNVKDLASLNSGVDPGGGGGGGSGPPPPPFGEPTP